MRIVLGLIGYFPMQVTTVAYLNSDPIRRISVLNYQSLLYVYLPPETETI